MLPDERPGHEEVVPSTKISRHVPLQADPKHLDTALQHGSLLADEVPRLHREQGMARQGTIKLPGRNVTIVGIIGEVS